LIITSHFYLPYSCFFATNSLSEPRNAVSQSYGYFLVADTKYSYRPTTSESELLYDSLLELSGGRQRWCRLCSVSSRRLNRRVAGHHCWVDDCAETATHREVVQHRRPSLSPTGTSFPLNRTACPRTSRDIRSVTSRCRIPFDDPARLAINCSGYRCMPSPGESLCCLAES